MKRLLIGLGILLCCLHPILAATKTDRDELRLNDDVHFMTVYDDQKLVMKYSFDKDGGLISGFVYDTDSTIKYRIAHATGTDENAKGFEWRDAAGKLIYKRIDNYDDLGNITGYTFVNADSSVYLKQTYGYDGKGNRAKRDSGVTDDHTPMRESYLYDANGNIATKREYNNGKLEKEYKYEYILDEHKNWKKRSSFLRNVSAGDKDFSPSTVTDRKFSYYSDVVVTTPTTTTGYPTTGNPATGPVSTVPFDPNANSGFADNVHILKLTDDGVKIPDNYRALTTWTITGDVPNIKAGDFLTAGDPAHGNVKFVRAVTQATKNPDGSVTVVTQRVPPTALPKRQPPVTQPGMGAPPTVTGPMDQPGMAPTLPAAGPGNQNYAPNVRLISANGPVKIAGLYNDELGFLTPAPALNPGDIIVADPQANFTQTIQRKIISVSPSPDGRYLIAKTVPATPDEVYAAGPQPGMMPPAPTTPAYQPNVLSISAGGQYRFLGIQQNYAGFANPAPPLYQGCVLVIDPQPSAPQGLQLKVIGQPQQMTMGGQSYTVALTQPALPSEVYQQNGPGMMQPQPPMTQPQPPMMAPQNNAYNPNVRQLPTDGSVRVAGMSQNQIALAGAIPPLTPGDIIICSPMAGAPQGFQRKVLAISQQNTYTILQTAQAMPNEIYQQTPGMTAPAPMMGM